ncbi:MAG: hypothetical protein JW814_03800 [Candidatus Krumholzibacteriota bacterium]|nr:hypothetical protein [Candidatus Krumholzibacteriota bacterium]
MNHKKRLALGSVMSIIGAAGMILGPVFGATDLTGPWSFITGFLTGLTGGIGVALALSGLIDSRKSR